MNRYLILLFLFFWAFAKAQPETYKDWKFKKMIFVKSNENKTLSDYSCSFSFSIEELRSDHKIKPDFSDIRVTDEDNNILCYWVDTSEHDKINIWFRIPELKPLENKICHLLYGNPSATSASNGDCAFMLFDDFNGSAYDKGKWDLQGNAVPVLSNGSIHFKGAHTDQFLISKYQFHRPLIAEMKVSDVKGSFPAMSFIFNSSFGYIGGYSLAFEDRYKSMQLWKMQPSVCGAFEMNYPHSNPESCYNALGLWSLTLITTNDIMAHFEDKDIIEGNTFIEDKDLKIGLGLLSCGNKDQSRLSVDWIRLRSFTQNPPSISVSSEYANDKGEPSPSPQLIGLIKSPIFINAR